MEPLLSSSICRSCRNRLNKLPSRSFSTTNHRQIIPPESPNYIAVPASLQQGFHQPRRIKGLLPTPKEIFPRTSPNKTNPFYISRLTRDPKPSNQSTTPISEFSEQQLYKQRMTQLRKQHLREGLLELHARKQTQDRERKARSDTMRAERARLISQAEREDARLTNVSVPSAMDPNTKLIFSPKEALVLHHRKKQNVRRNTAHREKKQASALHVLYMNARNFITNEEQLLKKITEEFDEKNFDAYSEGAKSYWDSQGPPDGIAQMVIRSTMGSGKQSVSEKEEAWKRDQERMKSLAEGLSGGKM